MEFEEKNIKLSGHYKLEVYEGEIEKKDGEIINKLLQTIEGDNIITTSGKGLILDRIYGLSAVAAMSRIGVGTSATAAALGDTSLTGGVYVVFDTVATRSGLVTTSTATYGTGVANFQWQEIATDNGTTMLSRIAPIGPFTKTPSVSIVITYTITQN